MRPPQWSDRSLALEIFRVSMARSEGRPATAREQRMPGKIRGLRQPSRPTFRTVTQAGPTDMRIPGMSGEISSPRAFFPIRGITLRIIRPTAKNSGHLNENIDGSIHPRRDRAASKQQPTRPPSDSSRSPPLLTLFFIRSAPPPGLFGKILRNHSDAIGAQRTQLPSPTRADKNGLPDRQPDHRADARNSQNSHPTDLAVEAVGFPTCRRRFPRTRSAAIGKSKLR